MIAYAPHEPNRGWHARNYNYQRLRRIMSHAFPPEPFLCLPLPEGAKFAVTEGWLYSSYEKSVHGHALHGGVDFASERGTKIVAAADGWAVASFQAAYAGRYEGRRVGYGLGSFVQIWHPTQRTYTAYGHLESVSPRIPALTAKRLGDEWVPEGLHVPPEQLRVTAAWVEQGQCIGEMGDSGLSWGYPEEPGIRPDPASFPSWDEVHLHFEVYRRSARTLRKVVRWDPFGIYGSYEEYRSLASREQSLWLRDAAGRPRFAAEPGGTVRGRP